MIKICDAIMGSGKSSAAIAYMNANPDKKFIYITPYLEQTERIEKACPSLHFKRPSNKIPEHHFNKYNHTIQLLVSGENIASTHNMFLRYTSDMVDMIKKHKYILIIDEVVDVLHKSEVSPDDVRILKSLGWVTDSGQLVDCEDVNNYKGSCFKEILKFLKGNDLVTIGNDGIDPYYYWIFNKEILNSFADVYILTYMFDCQMMKYYLDVNNILTKKIGVMCKDGKYYFNQISSRSTLPSYLGNLSDKIHIFDNSKLNAVGDDKFSLSVSWFNRYDENALIGKDELRRNVCNYFRHYYGDVSSDQKMWTTFSDHVSVLRGKGFYRSDVAFNTRAVNSFRNKTVLAYCINLYMNPFEKSFLLKNGAQVLEDQWALSVMIQWIWRSAIRDGKDIYIYIPSKRMRELLSGWISSVQSGYKKACA